MYDRAISIENGGILYITDNSERARALMRQKEAVLVWLHDGNRQEDFGFCRYACEDVTELSEAYLYKVYCRQKGLPAEILETAHCVVRETTVEDVDSFYRLYADPAITRYMEPLYEDPDEERAYARDYIDQVYAFYDFGMWTVLLKESKEVIGRAGICYREGYADPEIGFMIGCDWQGRGLATEVCSGILSYAKEELGFEKVLAFVRPENAASVQVCRKIGMQLAGNVQLNGILHEVYAT